MSASSARPLWKTLAFLALAAVLLAGFSHEVGLTNLSRWYLDYRWAPWPSAGEGLLFELQWLYALPATLLLAAVLQGLAPGLLERVGKALTAEDARGALAVLVVVALALNWVVRVFITRRADFTDDERLYWYQAQVLLDGSVMGPLNPVDRVFDYEFIMRTAGGDGLAGLFTVGQPLLLALGSLVGDRDLTQWLAVGALVLLTFRLTELVWGRPVGLMAAAFVALSPWLLFAAASRHNGVPTAVFTAGALVCSLEWHRRPTFGWAVGQGFCVAWVFLLRSLDGTVLAALLGGAAAWHVLRARERQRWLSFIAFAAALGLGVSFQLYVNWRSTGHWWRPVYSLWLQRDWPDAILFGFGKGTWHVEQTPWSSLGKTLLMASRVAQWFGGNVVLFAYALVGLSVEELRRPARWLLGWAALFVVAYALFIFPSVQDFGTVYHLALLPLLAGAAAAGVRWVHARVGWGRGVLAAAAIVSLLTFCTFQATRLSDVADINQRPLDLAEQVAGQENVKLLVLWRNWQGEESRSSWVLKAPPLSPRREEAVVWARDEAGAEARLAAAFPDRVLMRLVWKGPGQPELEPVQVPPAVP